MWPQPRYPRRCGKYKRAAHNAGKLPQGAEPRRHGALLTTRTKTSSSVSPSRTSSLIAPCATMAPRFMMAAVPQVFSTSESRCELRMRHALLPQALQDDAHLANADRVKPVDGLVEHEQTRAAHASINLGPGEGCTRADGGGDLVGRVAESELTQHVHVRGTQEPRIRRGCHGNGDTDRRRRGLAPQVVRGNRLQHVAALRHIPPRVAVWR